ncbi:MAG TPA: glycosyltransferase family 87 protein [Afifellaceae bacterium]|nr:glycosyltransferase family 87 protein [Afifellaceae bacterium]
MARTSNIGEAIRTGGWLTAERLRVYVILLTAASLFGVVFLWLSGSGLLDSAGRPIGTDFANPYSAGVMAQRGQPAAAYDYATHYREQQAIFAAALDDPGDLPFYGWHYPPVFFLAAAALAALPYIPALLVWLGSTFALYMAAMRTILARYGADGRTGLLLAAAFPAVFVTIAHGQNAFLTAGCLGLGLVLLDRRPFLAGLFIGLLCYKPHLGIVLPLVLLAGGYWRAFIAAGVTVAVLCLLTLVLFGVDPWTAFLESRTVTRTVVLEQVGTGWYKIQSVFSAIRGLGGPVPLAYAVQGAVALAVLGSLAWIWRQGATRANMAAACVGSALITPYILDYDMMVLAPAIALLALRGRERGFRPYEISLLAFCWLLPVLARPVAQYAHLPIGMMGMLVLFGWAVRLSLEDGRQKATVAA